MTDSTCLPAVVMSPTQSSTSSDERYLEACFGPLLSISHRELINLASNLRNRISPKTQAQSIDCRFVTRLNGSYNLVHILEFSDHVKYVIRVPVTGWGDRFDETAKSSLKSEALTMRFIRKETTIPVPDVYAFDTTNLNEIGAPYILMSFIPGFTVSSMWFDKSGPTPLEDRRQRVLNSVAEAMAQLERFQFDKIGSLQFNGDLTSDGITIGPCYIWDEETGDNEDDEEKMAVKQLEPFNTSKSYLQYFLDNEVSPKHFRPLAHGCKKLLASMIRYLPSSTSDQCTGSESETFVLSIPDYDSQNIMIDERGNLTGIIDWDHVQSLPRFLGYSSFPGWITRDWDPLMYHYPRIETEDSPEELEQYRQQYCHKMNQLLQGKNDARFTMKSHIYEAVAIAIMNRDNRLYIMQILVGRLGVTDWESDTLSFISDIGLDELSDEDERRLEDALRALLSIGETGLDMKRLNVSGVRKLLPDAGERA